MGTTKTTEENQRMRHDNASHQITKGALCKGAFLLRIFSRSSISQPINMIYGLLTDLLKRILACSTYRANPVIRQFFEGCSRLDIIFRIPLCGVVFITTNCALIDIHAISPLRFFDVSGSRRRCAPTLNLVIISIGHWVASP